MGLQFVLPSYERLSKFKIFSMLRSGIILKNLWKSEEKYLFWTQSIHSPYNTWFRVHHQILIRSKNHFKSFWFSLIRTRTRIAVRYNGDWNDKSDYKGKVQIVAENEWRSVLTFERWLQTCWIMSAYVTSKGLPRYTWHSMWIEYLSNCFRPFVKIWQNKALMFMDNRLGFNNLLTSD